VFERCGRALPQVCGGVPDTGAVASRGFEHSPFAFGEGGGLGGKDLQHADQVALIEDGNDQNGANAEAARDGGVDQRIGFSVGAKLGLARAETGAGKAIAGVERDAEVGSVKSGGGAADHFVAARQR
jgi:hypothetical protein